MGSFNNHRTYGKKFQQRDPRQIRRANEFAKYRAWQKAVAEDNSPEARLADWINQMQWRIEPFEPVRAVYKLHRSRGFSAGLRELDLICTEDHTDYADFHTVSNLFYGVHVILPSFEEFLTEHYPGALPKISLNIQILAHESKIWTDPHMIHYFETETEQLFISVGEICQAWVLISKELQGMINPK
jgi:hypothetical protein